MARFLVVAFAASGLLHGVAYASLGFAPRSRPAKLPVSSVVFEVREARAFEAKPESVPKAPPEEPKPSERRAAAPSPVRAPEPAPVQAPVDLSGVTLTNMQLAARESPQQPFLTATRVHADVPLAVYAGRLVLDDVVLDAGHLTIVIDEQGRTNLPGRDNDAPPPAEPRALALRALHLSDFAVLYDDRQTPMRISATGVEAQKPQTDDVRIGTLRRL